MLSCRLKRARRTGGATRARAAADGTPANPLVVVDLDRWRDAPAGLIQRAAALVADALPVTAACLAAPAASLEPLVTATTLTLTARGGGWRTADRERECSGQRHSRRPDLSGALSRLRAAVGRSPRAAIACGQLVRQTAVLDTAGGLAAEASAYSLLLGGPEFAQWLGQRGAPRASLPARRAGPGQQGRRAALDRAQRSGPAQPVQRTAAGSAARRAAGRRGRRERRVG